MLEKIAKLANELDHAGLFKEADALTEIMNRVAESTVGDFEEDEPFPHYQFPGQDKRWHQRQDIDVDDPEFMREFEEKNPSGWQWWQNRRNQEPGNRAKPSTHYLHGVPVRMGPGHSDLKPSEIARFLYPDDVLSENTERVRELFEKATRGKKRRGTFNVDYASGKGPEEGEDLDTYRERLSRPRKFVFDPELLEKYLKETGRDASGLPLFDRDIYQGLFNPVHPEFNKYDPQREKVNSGEKGLGWLAGHAYRHLDPAQTFGFGPADHDLDEEDRKKPHWYMRS